MTVRADSRSSRCRVKASFRRDGRPCAPYGATVALGVRGAKPKSAADVILGGVKSKSKALSRVPVAVRFQLDREETGHCLEWCADHREECPVETVSDIGGRFCWAFTPTTAGMLVQVRCVCGAKLDVAFRETDPALDDLERAMRELVS